MEDIQEQASSILVEQPQQTEEHQEAQQPVTLITSDGKTILMPKGAAIMSKTIENLVGDLGADTPIPLPTVNEDTMLHVKAFAEYKLDNPNPPPPVPPKNAKKKEERRSDDILEWDKAFMAKLELTQLYDLVTAANYLEFKDLFDVCCKTLANMMKGKTPDEICETFGIECDFTPEERQKIRDEHEWVDERQ